MRLLHTADWQLGLKLRFIPGERGALARDARFRVVETLAAKAHEHQVDAVVVAGDVFDDNQVSPHTLQKARDALQAFAPIPVYLIAGNHDAAEPGNALERLQQGTRPLPHVHVLLSEDPVPLGDHAVLYPCPLTRRHHFNDPTRHLPARTSGDPTLRIAIAHGGVRSFADHGEVANLIDADAAR